MLEFLRENSTLLFGGGGIGAFLLVVLKHIRDGKPKSAPPKAEPTIRNGNIGGDFVGGNKSTRTGIGALELAIILFVILAVVGLFLLLASPGDNPATAIAGDGNTVSQGADLQEEQ